MLDIADNSNEIKEKYLFMMLSGGEFITVRLQTPLHSDTYLRALMLMEDD